MSKSAVRDTAGSVAADRWWGPDRMINFIQSCADGNVVGPPADLIWRHGGFFSD